jgi:hypothetical protein
MTITFENYNDVILYAFENVVAYARKTQQIFVAHCIWWLASVIGLEQELINYIDNIQTRQEVIVVPEKTPEKWTSISPVPRDIQEDTRQERVLKECEEFLQELKKLRARNTVNTNKRNRVNPLASTKKSLTIEKKRKLKDYSMMEGIDEAEIQRRKGTGECLWCAWPPDRKGTHRVKDCLRPITLDKGTADFSKAKGYNKMKQFHQQPTVEEDRTEESGSEESSDESL